MIVTQKSQAHADSSDQALEHEEHENPRYPTLCKDYSQFKSWQKTRPWLEIHTDDSSKVICATCQKVKTTGLLPPTSVLHKGRKEQAFVTHGATAKTAKKLLKKIDRHRDSEAHIQSC